MKITLKSKKLKSGRNSLYIEYYKGTVKSFDGTVKHNRDFEYLKLYLHNTPTTPREKQENKENQELAENILAIRKAEYAQGKFSLKDRSKPKVLFLDYYNKVKEERLNSSQNYTNWQAAQKHILQYCPKSLTMDEVDTDFVKGFKNFLDTKARTTGNQPLSQNSKYTYYNKFKACINSAFDEGYIARNPLRGVKGFALVDSKREYLTLEELKALANTECKIPVLKRAFIFSCLTGMRWSDINKLVWEEVRDETDGCRIVFRQKKTDGVEYLDISKQARQLLGERNIEDGRVFVNLRYSATANNEIRNWCMRAGITKYISFHCGRHTNAVLLLENGADIYTVSKRLGHKELKTTEIYAKIINSKMKEAANIIPNINI